MEEEAFVQLYDKHAPEWTKELASMKEMVIANLVMTAQIPAKTFEEQARASFVLDRFIECGINTPSIDEMGNVIGLIPGKNAKQTIVLSAHLDTLFSSAIDHNVSISADKAEGTGIADNAMGLTVLLTLPDILKRLELEFDSNIILLATAASKEKGDLSGMRHYMKEHSDEVDFNINLEGITLGQVDHSALSRVRCDIQCDLDGAVDSSWRSLGQNSAIMMLSDVLESLFSIPLPRKPKTVMNVGKIAGGNSYSRVCDSASLSLEVRSEDDAITDKLIEEIKDNCYDIGAKYGLEVDLNFFSRHRAAGIRYSHPLVRAASVFVKKLGFKPKMGTSNSEIAVPLSMDIPSITVGITSGSEDSSSKSYIDLDPIPNGITQVLLLIKSIDKGYCNDEPS